MCVSAVVVVLHARVARPACLAVVHLWGLDPLNGLSWTILLVCVEGGGEQTKPNIEFLQKG